MGRIRLIRQETRWVWALAVIAAAGCLATAVVFSPGYMSNDTLFQLKQAKGSEPLSDWHPPVMSLLWRALIAVTGTPASMALAQTLVLWAALWAIAWCVWEATASRPGSLAVLGIGAAPWVLTFAGVVWKDVQMAFALLAACAVALAGRRLPAGRTGLRRTLLVLGLLLLAYAVLVRKNAVFAAVPIFVLLVLALHRHTGRRVWVIASSAFALAVLVPSIAISALARPVATSQGTQIMLDDLLHVVSPKELGTASAPPDLRHHLAAAAGECHRIKSLSNSYWTCYGRGAHGPFTAVAHTDRITSLWLHEMPRHPAGYAGYRLEVFTNLLFHNRDLYQPGITANDLGQKVSHPRLEATLGTYVHGAARDLPFLFAGWFWLAAALTLSMHPGRGAFRTPVRALGISSAAYVLGYLPIVPATDFRYVYWPVLAGTLGLLLAWLGRAPAQPPEAERSRSAVHVSEA